jgi:cell division protein FtsI (penicillin-binding protein 3)
MRSRVIILVIFFSSLLSIITVRLVFLQLLPNAPLERLQKTQYSRTLVIPAQRGKILDRNGGELATSISSQSLFADPTEIKAPRKLAKRLSQTLGIPYKLILFKIQSERRFIWIKRQLDDSLVSTIKSWSEPGLGFIEEGKRSYPNQKLLAQCLGFVGSEGEGLEGLEKKYNSELKGEKQTFYTRRDARGRPLVVNGQIFELSADGATIETTIDRELQYELEYQLAEVARDQRAERAMGIIMDPMTGEILAIASSPEKESQTFRNHPIADIYEPGSTFKIVAAASALKSGRIQPSTKYFCENGKFQIGKHMIHEAEDTHGFGWLTLAEILEKSSNIGTTKVVFDVGQENFKKTIEDFGFSQKTGVDLPGEAVGLLNKEAWPDHLFSNISFGHGVGVTALQLANAYAAVANGGKLLKPFIVKRIMDSDQNIISERSPQLIRQVLTQKESSLLTLMLSGVTQEGGTGVLAKVDGYPVAGKTGTAQKVNPNSRGYMRGAYIASFAGFVPSNNPQFVIYVMVDHPKKQIYGAQVAAPVFQRLASFALHKRGFMPIEVPTTLVHSPNNNLMHESVKLELSESEMPSVEGLTLREAADALRKTSNLGDEVEFIGKGIATSQWPQAHTSMQKNSRIKVYFKPL